MDRERWRRKMEIVEREMDVIKGDWRERARSVRVYENHGLRSDL